jgi:hypothetical protein
MKDPEHEDFVTYRFQKAMDTLPEIELLTVSSKTKINK